MARQRLANTMSDTTKKFENPGDSLSGNYLGARTATTTYGEAQIHAFYTPDGIVDCWGSKALDRGLKAIAAQAPGAMVWIVFKGKVRHGNKSPKTFDIDWDPDDCVDVASIWESTAAQDVDPEDEEDDAADEVKADFPTPGKATVSAANVANAAKLLQKKRNEKTA